MDISCQQDFDADHPAGTSLGDIIRFLGKSDYPYIQSGYKPEMEHTHFDKLLTELTPDDLILLDNYWLRFRLTKTPAPGSYTFTVNFRSPAKTVTGKSSGGL